MKKTKKAQVSFEYMLLFSFALLIFIVAGTMIISGLEKTRQLESESEYLVREIKSATIIASLSESEYKTTIEIPVNIAGKPIQLDLYGSPDNLLRVWDVTDEPKQVSSAFLPVIAPVTQEYIVGGYFLITKEFEADETEVIKIEHVN